MSQVRNKLDPVYELYSQGKPSDAARAASNFLVQNPDPEYWSVLIEDCLDSGMLGFLIDVTDLTLQHQCFDFELHQMMAGVFRHADDHIRSEAWIQKYPDAQGDAIVQLAEEGRVDEAATKFMAVMEEAKEDVLIPEHLFNTVSRAGNPKLLSRVAAEYDAWYQLDPDAAERVVGQLRVNGEPELAATCLRRHIAGEFLDAPSATRLLMEVMEDTSDHDQAEQLMKDINEHVTDSAGDDEFDRYLGELAPTYAIFARMGADRRETSRTQALFEQALELTEVGCSGKAWCETLHMYARWLESIGEISEAKLQRSRIVGAPERYASVGPLISRWLVTRTASSGQEAHNQLNAILDQLEHPILMGNEINRLLPLVLELDGRRALRNVCDVLWHRCIEDGCCPIELAAWLIAVNHNGLIKGPDDLQKRVRLGSVCDFSEQSKRYVAYIKSLLAEDFVGAASAAEQMFAAESINPTSEGAIHAKTLLAYSTLRQGNYNDAARHYEELIDAAKKRDIALDLETWDDATTTFEKSGRSECLAMAQAIADELRRATLSLKAPTL